MSRREGGEKREERREPRGGRGGRRTQSWEGGRRAEEHGGGSRRAPPTGTELPPPPPPHAGPGPHLPRAHAPRAPSRRASVAALRSHPRRLAPHSPASARAAATPAAAAVAIAAAEPPSPPGAEPRRVQAGHSGGRAGGRPSLRGCSSNAPAPRSTRSTVAAAALPRSGFSSVRSILPSAEHRPSGRPSILLRAQHPLPCASSLSACSASSSELSVLLSFLSGTRGPVPTRSHPTPREGGLGNAGEWLWGRVARPAPLPKHGLLPIVEAAPCVRQEDGVQLPARGCCGDHSVLKPWHPLRVGRGGPWLLDSGPGGGPEHGKDSVRGLVRDYGEGPGAAGSCSHWQCGSGGETPIWQERRDPGRWIRTSAPV